jgi:hypothetical protein
VILDYGIVMLEEFGRQRPFSEHGPRAGRLLVTGLPPVASLNQGGLLVHADLTQFADWHFNTAFEAQDAAKARAEALAVARGLRPLPPDGGKALREVETPTASFLDPVGDAGAPPDIARVEIEPAAGDQLEFTLTVAGRRCVGFGGSGGPMIGIDRDQNPDTGSAYYGAAVAITAGNAGQVLRADGWDLRRAPVPVGNILHAQVHGSCKGKRFELYVPRKVIGVGPLGGFNASSAVSEPGPTLCPVVERSTTSRCAARRRRSWGWTHGPRTSRPSTPSDRARGPCGSATGCSTVEAQSERRSTSTGAGVCSPPSGGRFGRRSPSGLPIRPAGAVRRARAAALHLARRGRRREPQHAELGDGLAQQT